MPMPPYFSGTGPPSRPSGAILRRTSLGKVSFRSRSRAPGAISLSAKSFASLRIDCCSEVRSKSIAPSLLTRGSVRGEPPCDRRDEPLGALLVDRMPRAFDDDQLRRQDSLRERLERVEWAEPIAVAGDEQDWALDRARGTQTDVAAGEQKLS